MNETMQAIEKDIGSTPGVRLVLANAGGSFLGGVNQGNLYVRVVPHEERTFSLGRLWTELKNGNPLNAFRNNYSQQDVMLEVRRRLQKYAPMRTGVRNAPSFNFGAGGRYDIDFNLRGPDIVALAGYADELMKRSQTLGGIVDADTTLKLNKPELRVEIDRARAADLGVDSSDIATSLRLMVGGEDRASRFRDESINEDYDVQLRGRTAVDRGGCHWRTDTFATPYVDRDASCLLIAGRFAPHRALAQTCRGSGWSNRTDRFTPTRSRSSRRRSRKRECARR